MITLTQLEYVIAVDEHRHFATAAERCCVTQPTLSMQIKKLEEDLGVVIFDRSRQPVVPTDIGGRLIEQARLVIAATRRMEEIINEDRQEVAGSLKIGIIPTLAPYLLPIFIGIFLGVVLGSIPIMFPGVPQPVKLGLAGGPLIVAILVGRYGPRYKLVTFTTNSANMMIREIGISLFLAAVGLGAGESFVSSVVNGGYWWVLYGAVITVLPLLIAGIIARKLFKLDYFSIMGLLSGSMTDPPALAYANTVATNDNVSVAYATVYPLTMFMRIFAAQILVLIALS